MVFYFYNLDKEYCVVKDEQVHHQQFDNQRSTILFEPSNIPLHLIPNLQISDRLLTDNRSQHHNTPFRGKEDVKAEGKDRR